MKILRLATEKDTDSLRFLWLTVFPSDAIFFEYYLKFASFENIVVCSDDENIISMLNMLPCELISGRDLIRGSYVFSIATMPKFRNKGVASEVINFSHQLMLEREMAFSALIPAEKNLFPFYSRFGYEPYFKINKIKIPLKFGISDCRKANYNDIHSLSFIYKSEMKSRIHFKRPDEFWKILLDTENCLVSPSTGDIEAYCFFDQCPELVIKELFGMTQKSRDILLYNFGSKFSHAELQMPVDIEEGYFLGLIKPFSAYLVKDDLPPYINMMFNA